MKDLDKSNFSEKGISTSILLDEKLTPFAANKIIGIPRYEGLSGPNYSFAYEMHTVENALKNDMPKMTFEASSATYRVMYITKPVYAQGFVPINTSPPDPFGSCSDSNIYVVGIKTGGDAKAPNKTPWLNLNNIKITIF